MANRATKQYSIGTPTIIAKYFKDIGTKPIISPKKEKGTAIATILSRIEEKYTILDALLCTKGNFAVLIICIPIKLDTTPYENQIVWNTAASLIPNINQIEEKTIISKRELRGPIKSIKCFKLFKLHIWGFSKYSSSTLS